MAYDARVFGDFGWKFVRAGEQYRKLEDISMGEQLTMCGLFKQATMGDCQVDESDTYEIANEQRIEWLKFKGLDTFDAMQLYIEKVKCLSKIYDERRETDSRKPIQSRDDGLHVD